MIVIHAQRNTLVQTCPDQELTAVTYPKTDLTDRYSHKEVVIAETGVKEYTAYVEIGYQCLSDVMIHDANDFEVGIMTIPFSMLISISNNYYHLVLLIQVLSIFNAVLYQLITLMYL